MISKYPEEVPVWFHPASEESMEVVKEAIHGARSLRADYRVPNHVKADFYFRSESEEVRRTLTEQA